MFVANEYVAACFIVKCVNDHFAPTSVDAGVIGGVCISDFGRKLSIHVAGTLDACNITPKKEETDKYYHHVENNEPCEVIITQGASANASV